MFENTQLSLDRDKIVDQKERFMSMNLHDKKGILLKKAFFKKGIALTVLYFIYAIIYFILSVFTVLKRAWDLNDLYSHNQDYISTIGGWGLFISSPIIIALRMCVDLLCFILFPITYWVVKPMFHKIY